MKSLKSIIKKCVPPFVLKIYAKYFMRYGWFGTYSSWRQAQKHSSGYDSDIILKKVSSALQKVKSGKAVFERDSVLFDEIQYDWPMLVALLYVFAKSTSKTIHILDFGGSLGSTYFQNKKFLDGLSIKWHIVEQENYVKEGKKHFEDGTLIFHDNLSKCLEKFTPDVVLFSSSLEYVDVYKGIISKVVKRKVPYIIFDKTPFDKKQYITVQKVPPSIYPASYPCWIFEEVSFLKLFKGYHLIESWKNEVLTNRDFVYKGFLLKYN